ncbi:Bromodomain-containing factor 1 [Cytospora mali]|uniref:Bromodomain-containing factor 1 n=1 Tax=Cytospora mali TaxID=578113 RepID=A0A194W8V2_CYTMA|nr:Bromodomain-containing factor 1 [Valsa mali]
MFKKVKKLDKELCEPNKLEERDLLLGIDQAIHAAHKSSLPLQDVLKIALGSIMEYYEMGSDAEISFDDVIIHASIAKDSSTCTSTASTAEEKLPKDEFSTDETPTNETSTNQTTTDETSTTKTSTSDATDAVIESLPTRVGNTNPLKRKASTELQGPRRRFRRGKVPRLRTPSTKAIMAQMWRLELRFCDEIIEELIKPKHLYCNRFFLTLPDHEAEPLDENSGIMLQPDSMVIRLELPVTLACMEEKKEAGEYRSAKDMREDFSRMVGHVWKTFPEGHIINDAAHDLSRVFARKWSRKSAWMREEIAEIEARWKEGSDAASKSDSDSDSDPD